MDARNYNAQDGGLGKFHVTFGPLNSDYVIELTFGNIH